MNIHAQGGENELLVFISSVMDEDLNPARELVVKAIEELPFGRPWAFEYTPASSESATDVYLRKVEEADFVVWLVGSNTSQAVVNEVQRCLGCHGRLLVFKLPAECRDETTEGLLATVTPWVKWKDIGDLSQLASEIIAALSEEIRVALRDPLGVARNKVLGRALDRSLAGCTVSFSALGVPDDLVEELGHDTDVGHVLDDLVPGFYVIEGPQGSGKTLACQRLFQKAVKRALVDLSAAFPVFVDASDVGNDLWDTIDSCCDGYVNSRVQSVLVIVDGIDERGAVEAKMLLREMESYARGNPKATLVATVRPIPGLDHNGNAITMPTLDDDQIVSLVAKISGVPSETIHPTMWSVSLRESSRFPLFSVMIGVWLRQSSEMRGLSSHELVEYLAKTSVAESVGNGEETDVLLQVLATKAVTYGARVRPHEVTPRLAKQRLLADSRLVHATESGTDFALPIFREWYAARAILEGTTLVEQIDLESDRWTIPLSIAVHSDNTAVAEAVMVHLAAANPSVAAGVLKDDEGVWFWGDEESGALGEAIIVGEEIRRTMGVWAQGLGPLFGVIGPVGLDGNVGTLGVRVDGRMLGRSWYCGNDQLGPVVEFNADYDPMRRDAAWELRKDWPKWIKSGVPPTKLWHWLITKSDLVEDLGKAMSRRHLSYEASDAVDELVWEFSEAVGRSLGRHDGSIEIQSVLERIERVATDPRMTWAIGGNAYRWKEIEVVKNRLSGLLKSGREILSDPWPDADLPSVSGSGWSRYSDERLLERTQSIFMAALRIYRAMVEKWFPSFVDRLGLYRLMPVRLEGRLVRGHRGNVGWPRLSWCPVILPLGECSTVAFDIGTEFQNYEYWDGYFESQIDAFARLRGGDTERLGLFHTSGWVPGWEPRPATELAYGWLSGELIDLGWAKW